MGLETASEQTEDDRQEDEGMEHSEQGNKEEDLQAEESINVFLECVIFQTLYLEEGGEYVRGGARCQDECQEGAEAPVENSGSNVPQCLHCSLVARS